MSPKAAPKPCAYPGCSALTTTGRCDKHPAPSHGWGDDRARGSRHDRGYDYQWVKTRERILRRDSGLCQECRRKGRPEPAKDVDHIIPKAHGGGDEDGNLQSLCKACHQDKTARESLAAKRNEKK